MPIHPDSERLDRQIRRLAATGLTVREIAKRVKLDPANVCRRLSAMRESWRQIQQRSA